MKVAYIVVCLAGALYFLLKKRRFDFLTVGYFSATVYFLPAWYGIVIVPITVYSMGPVPLIGGAYLVMLVVISAILAAAIIYDAVPHRSHRHIRLSGSASAGNWALVLGATGLVMSVLTIGVDALLNADKNVVLESLNRWQIFWQFGGALAVVFFFQRRMWLRLSLATLLVLADVFIGFRLSFAFAFIACFALWAERQGRQRFLLRHLRPILIAGSLIAFLFVYKSVYVLVKEGEWGRVAQRLTSLQAYDEVITSSEPFITQSILNQVMLDDFHVPFSHFSALFYQLTMFAPSFGAKFVSFNDYFQPALFPLAVDIGLANNIWAEMWSTGGWPLLLAFLLLDVIMLGYMSALMRVDNPELRAALSLPFVCWAFYLHRNDLFVETNLVKRLVLIGATCILLAMLSHDATHRIRRRVAHGLRRVVERHRRRQLQDPST